MGPDIIFMPSAFKHGITEADIRQAVSMSVSDVIVNQYEDKYALIGFDTKGNAIEVLYNMIDKETIEVYHAMKCRKSFRKKYGPKGEDYAAFDR